MINETYIVQTCHIITNQVSGKDILKMMPHGPFLVPYEFMKSFLSNDEMQELLNNGSVVSGKYYIKEI